MRPDVDPPPPPEPPNSIFMTPGASWATFTLGGGSLPVPAAFGAIFRVVRFCFSLSGSQVSQKSPQERVFRIQQRFIKPRQSVKTEDLFDKHATFACWPKFDAFFCFQVPFYSRPRKKPARQDLVKFFKRIQTKGIRGFIRGEPSPGWSKVRSLTENDDLPATDS